MKRTTSSPRAGIADYFRAAGVELAPGALDVPEVSTIAVHSDKANQWVDRSGTVAPPGVEFYRLDTKSPGHEQVLRRKTMPIAQGGEGWSRVPSEAGMHWITMDAEHQVVLMRTAEQKAVWLAAKQAAKSSRLGKRTATEHRGGDAIVTSTTETREQRIVLGGS